jgi:hypothetical protein
MPSSSSLRTETRGKRHGLAVIARNGRHLTTRWSGPGMLRQKREAIVMSVPARPCEGAIPGRSARSR